MEQNKDIIVYNLDYQYTSYHNKTTDFITGENPPYHKHDGYEIYLFISGNVKMYIEQTCYQLTPGDMAIVNPSELHRSCCLDSSPYERIGINIKPSVFDSLKTSSTNLASCFYSHAHGKHNMIHLDEDEMASYIGMSDDLIAASRSSDYGSDLLSYSYLIRLLIYVNSLYMKSSNDGFENLMPKMIMDTMDYINDHLTEKISLDDLAAELNYNGNYLSNRFKEHTGLTLRSYILSKRIDLAKSLLLAGQSVSDTCLMSGFNDYANFIRNFKRQVGMSPGRYKKEQTE